MTVCGLSLYLGSLKSHKTLGKKFIFQICTLNPYRISKQVLFIQLFLFSYNHIPTSSIVPLSVYKPTHNPQLLHLLWRAPWACGYGAIEIPIINIIIIIIIITIIIIIINITMRGLTLWTLSFETLYIGQLIW